VSEKEIFMSFTWLPWVSRCGVEVASGVDDDGSNDGYDEGGNVDVDLIFTDLLWFDFQNNQREQIGSESSPQEGNRQSSGIEDKTLDSTKVIVPGGGEGPFVLTATK